MISDRVSRDKSLSAALSAVLSAIKYLSGAKNLSAALSAVLSAVKYLSGAKNLSAAVLSAVKYLAGAKNLSAVTHISESVFFMPSGAETAAQAADVGRSLVQQLAGAMPVPGGRSATIARPTTSSRKMVS